MWRDIVGPSLAEYMADEAIEAQLTRLFVQVDLRYSLGYWDREQRADSDVNLPLRSLLHDLYQLDQAQTDASV